MIININVHELVNKRISVRKLQVEVEPKDRIFLLKSLICTEDPSLIPHRCYLLYGGRILEDERRCWDYNMQSFSELHLVRRHSRGPLFLKQKRPRKAREKRKKPPKNPAPERRSFRDAAREWVKGKVKEFFEEI